MRESPGLTSVATVSGMMRSSAAGRPFFRSCGAVSRSGAGGLLIRGYGKLGQLPLPD